MSWYLSRSGTEVVLGNIRDGLGDSGDTVQVLDATPRSRPWGIRASWTCRSLRSEGHLESLVTSAWQVVEVQCEFIRAGTPAKGKGGGDLLLTVLQRDGDGLGVQGRRGAELLVFDAERGSQGTWRRPERWGGSMARRC